MTKFEELEFAQQLQDTNSEVAAKDLQIVAKTKSRLTTGPGPIKKNKLDTKREENQPLCGKLDPNESYKLSRQCLTFSEAKHKQKKTKLSSPILAWAEVYVPAAVVGAAVVGAQVVEWRA